MKTVIKMVAINILLIDVLALVRLDSAWTIIFFIRMDVCHISTNATFSDYNYYLYYFVIRKTQENAIFCFKDCNSKF